MEFMGYDRKEYEEKIKTSPLFTLDKDTESSAYKRESMNMAGNLYGYLCAGNRVYEPAGEEITLLAIRCIENYDATKGEFLHYFNAAWKLEYSRIRRDQREEERLRGMYVTEKLRRTARCVKILKQGSPNYGTEEFYDTVSEAIGCTEEEYREAEEFISTTVYSDTYTNEEGEEQSRWDMIPSRKNFVDELASKGDVEEILRTIQEEYNHLQERQKGIVSDVMTKEVCPAVDCEKILHYSFVNKSMVQSWLKGGKLPTQREIAEKYGRNEASVSRTMNKFHEKVKEEWLKRKMQGEG